MLISFKLIEYQKINKITLNFSYFNSLIYNSLSDGGLIPQMGEIFFVLLISYV